MRRQNISPTKVIRNNLNMKFLRQKKKKIEKREKNFEENGTKESARDFHSFSLADD